MINDIVKLGLMPPLTGLVGIYGTEITRAGQIAGKEINDAGGILGRQLELVIEDDGSLPESAVAAANRLVHEHRCTAIIGNLLSNSRIAVAYQVAEPNRIPYLNFSFYEGSILSRYFFHFAALPNQQIDKMIPYMRKMFGPRMFFAGNNYEWPRGSIDAAKRALVGAGGEVVGEEYCPIGVAAGAIDALLDQVEAAAPDVFVPYFAGDDQVHLLTQFTERGMKQRMAVVMGHYDEVMTNRLSPAVREGFYSCNTYFMTVNTPENRDYLAALATWPGIDGIWPQGNGILTNFGEGAYLCVWAFALAANRAGSLNAEALVDALADIELAGPQGTVRMDPATHHARVNTYLSRCQNDGTFAIVEAFGATDPILPERYRHLRTVSKATLEDDIRLQARMLEQMSEAVFLIKTSDSTIIYVNPGAERMFGYGHGELIGKQEAVLHAHNGDAPINTAQILDILNRKGHWQGEIKSIRKDGRIFWCSVSASIFTHPMHGEVWLSVCNDITERKQTDDKVRESEQKFKSMTDTSPLAIYMSSGVEQKGEYMNPRFTKLFGYTMDDISSVLQWWPLAYPDENYREQVRKEWEKKVEQAIKTQSEIEPMETVVTCKDGSKKTISWGFISTGVQDWSFGLDLTDRKRAEEELRHFKDNLEQRVTEEVAKNRAKDHLLIQQSRLAAMGEMVHNIAHQWRQPLSALSIILANIKDAYDFQELTAEYFHSSVAQSHKLIQRMSTTIDDFRNFFRPDREPGEFDISQSVEDTLFVMEASLKHNQIQVIKDLPRGLMAYGFANQFSQVVLNIVANAKEALQERNIADGRIELCLHRTGDRGILTVQDNAGGIPEAILPKIFDPYFTTKEKGSGIGLYMSKMILEGNLSGAIAVTNCAPGTSVTLILPLLPKGNKA